MIYFIYTFVIVLSFLFVLNGFLKGARKGQIEAVLGILMWALIVLSFFIGGLKSCLISIALVFIALITSRRIASRTASRLLGGGGGYIGLPLFPLQKISQELGKTIDLIKLTEELLDGENHEEKSEKALFEYCQQLPEVGTLLHDFQISWQDFQALYHQLLSMGAGQWVCGHWIAASTLAYYEPLRFLLERKGKYTEESAIKTVIDLIMYFERGLPLER